MFIRGKITHEYDENGLLNDILIGDSSLLSLISHSQLRDGDEVSVQITPTVRSHKIADHEAHADNLLRLSKLTS